MAARKPGTPYDVAVWVGLSREISHVITEDGTEGGTPVNLGGASGKAYIKAELDDLDAAAIAEWTVDLTADPGNGVAEMTLDPAESLKLAPASGNNAKYHYDLHIKLADNFEFIGMWGSVEATWPASRAAV